MPAWPYFEDVRIERLHGMAKSRVLTQKITTDTDANPPRLPDGSVLGGRLAHVGRDTPWGLALRSHFFLGQDLPAAGTTPEEIAELIPEEFASALLQHCYNEFTFLARFLPSLFIAEHRDERQPAVPW